MTDTLTLYDLHASPNSAKARLALAYKNLPYKTINVAPMDRAEVLKVSGQPLTPVLTHGDRVIFDSSAILRYLDANFRDTPTLYSSDRTELKEIEKWELYVRTHLGPPIGTMFGQFRSPQKDTKAIEEACRLLHDSTAKIEESLSTGDWLVGNRLTAADITAAPIVFYGMLPKEMAQTNEVAKFFFENLKLGSGRDKARAWAMRVMKYDVPA